jgi:hypothetical protein
MSLPAGLGPGAIDTKGKAVFGCPGPGSYKIPTDFNEQHLEHESPAGKHIFPFHGAFTIKGRVEADATTSESPGPAAHTPSYSWIEPKSKQAPFGKASRSTEATRFISKCHPSGHGASTPGPGSYRYKCGPGHAKTFGDGPAVSIGTAQRPPVNAAADPDVPGAKYALPGALDEHVEQGFSIAPLNDRERGMARDRMSEAEKANHQYWGPGTIPPAVHDGPSPMQYVNKALRVSTAFHNAPVATFGNASRDALDKVCICYCPASAGHPACMT